MSLAQHIAGISQEAEQIKAANRDAILRVYKLSGWPHIAAMLAGLIRATSDNAIEQGTSRFALVGFIEALESLHANGHIQEPEGME